MLGERRKVIEEMIYNQPLLLLTIKDQEVLQYATDLFPYSVGFEIECNKKLSWSEEDFKAIPNIMAVICDGSEQRFRVPRGIKGLICLFHISECLKINSELNLGSGIHYHIDATQNFHRFTADNLKENEDWILNELDVWDYKGTYNGRGINSYDLGGIRTGSWIRVQSGFKTFEFRIGEMSFDYKHLVTDMIRASAIMRQYIDNVGGHTEDSIQKIENKSALLNFITLDTVNKQTKEHHETLRQLREKLEELETPEEEEKQDEEEEMKRIVNNRIIKNGRT